MSEPATGIARAPRSSWRWILLLLAAIVVIASVLVPLINIGRYHRSVANSLSRSLGHPVHLGSVQLQVLPHAGLTVTDFVVEENPGFGAEPILRAPSVLVTLRLLSLWGGHIEASRIDIDNASVNLVRNNQGQWNFNLLLLQAAHAPNASSDQRHFTARRFPYIEFRSARINFKNGAEKKAFSFLNADLSIWLEDPGQWRLRFEGQPVRTDLDLDLADTGMVRLDGSLNRATALDTIPLKLHAEWNKAPLGQASRMLLGEDSGWRGLLTAEADLTGDLKNLQVTTRLHVDDAHREEFTPLQQLNMDARCRANYHTGVESLDNLTCLLPAGDGHLLLTGSVQTPSRPQANLALEINHTPAEFAVTLLGLLRRGVTPSLSASGLINGHFSYVSGAFADGKSPQLTGEATVDSFAVTFPGLAEPLDFTALHFSTPSVGAQTHSKAKLGKKSGAAPKPDSGAAILLTATPVSLGAPSPLEISGTLTASGFQMKAAGEADIARLASIGKASGLLGSSLAEIRPMEAAATPPAEVDLTFTGPWMTPLNSIAPPTTTTGSIRIQHVEAKFGWLPEPVNIASATANFSANEVTWTNAAITVSGIGAHVSYSHPLGCPANEDCSLPGYEPPPGHFDADMPTLDLASVQSTLMGAGQHNEFFNAILAQVGRSSAPWPALEGTVHSGTLTLGTLVLHDARATLAIHGNRLGINSIDAAALGGSIKVTGSVQTDTGQPVYSLNCTWTGVSVPQIAAMFHEKWGAGTLGGNASINLQGYSAADLAASAHGTFAWDWTRGSLVGASGAALAAKAPAALRETSLSRPLGPGFSPAHFARWQTSGTIASRALTLDPSAEMNPVTGTISFERTVDLSWPMADGQRLRVGGTLASPAVEAAPVSAAQ